MDIKDNVKLACSRVQTVLRLRRRKEKRTIEISAPFNFKHEAVAFPGISEQEIDILREQAAASCIRVFHMDKARLELDAIPRSMSLLSHPEFQALGIKSSYSSLTSSQSGSL